MTETICVILFTIGLFAIINVIAIVETNRLFKKELMEWGDYDWTISNEEDERE